MTAAWHLLSSSRRTRYYGPRGPKSMLQTPHEVSSEGAPSITPSEAVTNREKFEAYTLELTDESFPEIAVAYVYKHAAVHMDLAAGHLLVSRSIQPPNLSAPSTARYPFPAASISRITSLLFATTTLLYIASTPPHMRKAHPLADTAFNSSYTCSLAHIQQITAFKPI
jgi:hypothetical protein